MAKATYIEVLKWASSFLIAADKEAYAAEYLLLERLNWSKTDWVNQLNNEMPLAEYTQFKEDLTRFIDNEPAQYIIGSCDFYGERFNVTPATLIPRPETEELVALCLANNSKSNPLKVVDIGTGTGAIALTLKRLAPNWEVSAVDLSAEALAVAQANATTQALSVTFFEGDLTTPLPAADQYDIVISNPPYIGSDEWAEMDESVRTHEPKMALFAANHGLALYEQLAKELPTRLTPHGKLYLEFGYRQGKALKELFQKEFPEKQVVIHRDLNGHERMLEMY